MTVIGAGRLGLCWALCVEQAGYHVKAVDIFPSYVDAINKRTLRSTEPRVMEMLDRAERLEAVLSIAEGASFSRYIYVFVQTPSSGSDRHYDHTHLSDVLSQLNALRVADKHIVICCTVMPGYCDSIAPALLRDCVNCTVSYSPEFIAQGAIIAGTLAPDMVLIGEGSPEAGAAIEELTLRYVTNAPAVHRVSAGSAEIAKLGLNSFVTLKIAFANFLGDLADSAEAARRRAAGSAAGSATTSGAASIRWRSRARSAQTPRRRSHAGVSPMAASCSSRPRHGEVLGMSGYEEWAPTSRSERARSR